MNAADANGLNGFGRIFKAVEDIDKPLTADDEALVQRLQDRRPYVNSHGDNCIKCGNSIKVQCFKDTGVCSEICRKLRDGEISEEAWAAVKAPSTVRIPVQ